MPKYFFHIDDGTQKPDLEGTEVPTLHDARIQAVEATGRILGDLDGKFCTSGVPWKMHVTDDAQGCSSRSNCRPTFPLER